MAVPMRGDDFDWAAELMQRRRAIYEHFSPVFWRPAVGVRHMHASFMRDQADQEAVVAVRSDRGFVLASVRPDGYEVDDFAVEEDDHWASDDHPRQLLGPRSGGRTRAHGGASYVDDRGTTDG